MPRTTTHWKCPSWFTIRCTSIRTPTNVTRNDTEAMNMRRLGRSGIVERIRNPSRVSCSNTSNTMTTRPANASSVSAPIPGIRSY